MKAILALAAFLCGALVGPAAFAWDLMADRTPLFEKRSYHSATGQASFDYYLLKPANYQPALYAYPLVLALPGVNGDSFGGYVLADQNMRAYQAFVLVPHAQVAGWSVAVFNDQHPEPSVHLVTLIEQLKKEFAIDGKRVYVTGYAQGGSGTFGIIAQYPQYFAAAAPLSGSGERRDAKQMAGTPMWIFHGAQDRAAPVKRSRDMVAAIRQAGGHPQYTEYPDGGHDIWGRTYLDPAFWHWLFSQRRTDEPTLPPPPAPDEGDEVVKTGPSAEQVNSAIVDQFKKFGLTPDQKQLDEVQKEVQKGLQQK